MNLSNVHALLSGRRRGPGASLLRGLLWAAQGPYALGARWRNRGFDHGRREIHRVPIPVVSVGNITTGGTGKTPLTAWIAQWFRDRGARVTLVSRGYGAEAGSRNDEALELERRLPDVPHLQNPNRVEAAETAAEELQAQVILLDDGFQHRRLHRDVDLVLLDAMTPFGYGHVLPRGLLREPLGGLQRASALILTRADTVDSHRRQQIRDVAMRYSGDKPWIEMTHAPMQLVSLASCETLSSLAGKRVAAFCGIGNPEGFRHTLYQCGCEVVELRALPDHHDYTSDDIETLTNWANQLDVDAVLCTEKDFVKIQVADLGNVPLWALRIGLVALKGENHLTGLLDSVRWSSQDS